MGKNFLTRVAIVSIFLYKFMMNLQIKKNKEKIHFCLMLIFKKKHHVVLRSVP